MITDRIKPKYLEENLFRCYFILHNSHMTPFAIESGFHDDYNTGTLVLKVIMYEIYKLKIRCNF
jgi:hypothetical protein